MAAHQSFPSIRQARALPYFESRSLMDSATNLRPKRQHRPRMLLGVLLAVAVVDAGILFGIVELIGGETAIVQALSGAASAIGLS